nr:hypothetical protein [Actinomadura rayongensis]
MKHVVIVVPGIGGSVLRGPDGRVVWGGGLSSTARSLAWPKRLDLAAPLEPVGLLPSISVVGPLAVPGYDRLLCLIKNAFDHVRVDVAAPGAPRDPRADVVLFPYDFRRGVKAAAERLAVEVRDRLGPSGDAARRVIVVGHSLGGLVARYWLGPMGGAAYCRALITVGTPHRGAPKALAWLMNGVKVGALPFRRATATLRDWPAAFDLLPFYPVVRGPDGTTSFPNELEWADAAWAKRADEARRMHEEIEASWDGFADLPPRAVPEVGAIFARGHTTFGRAELSPTGLTFAKADAEWMPNAGWLGDGTVPACSAIPLDLDERRTAWQAVGERHLPMASTSAIVESLRNFSGDSLRPTRGDAPERPWLGLDLDETVTAGQPFLVSAKLLGAEPTDDTVVEARIKEPGGGPAAKIRCVFADGTWSATVPPRPAGVYEVSVTAALGSGTGQIRVSDVVGVVEGEHE